MRHPGADGRPAAELGKACERQVVTWDPASKRDPRGWLEPHPEFAVTGLALPFLRRLGAPAGDTSPSAVTRLFRAWSSSLVRCRHAHPRSRLPGVTPPGCGLWGVSFQRMALSSKDDPAKPCRLLSPLLRTQQDADGCHAGWLTCLWVPCILSSVRDPRLYWGPFERKSQHAGHGVVVQASLKPA